MELLDSKKWILLIPPLLLLFIVFWNHELPFNSIRFVNLAIGGGTTLCLFCVFKQFKILGENKILLFVGKRSLVVYLLHTYFVTACRALFRVLHIDNPLIIIAGSSCLGVVIPLAIACVCEKMRIQQYLFAPYKALMKK